MGVPLPIFLAVPGLVAYSIGRASTPVLGLVLVAVVVLNVVWACLLKAPTRLGRERLDELAGYRRFLVSVEQDRMNRLNAPDAPPTVLAEHLPYAIALDVKEAWGDHLTDAFFGTTTQR